MMNLTYPYSSDTTQPMTYTSEKFNVTVNFNSGDGIPFVFKYIEQGSIGYTNVPLTLVTNFTYNIELDKGMTQMNMGLFGQSKRLLIPNAFTLSIDAKVIRYKDDLNVDQNDIAQIEQNQGWNVQIEGEAIALELTDFEIQAQDIPGWLVANENGLTVALDVTISPSLKAEGLAREIVNRIQNLRKESAFDVTDRILVQIDTTAAIQEAIATHKAYICAEVLANDIQFASLSLDKSEEIEAPADTAIQLSK
jgi:hypothetical protein